MTKRIHGKIARVLNSREVALNIGSMNGVTVGMYFDVMDPTGKDITDPDTDEILGSIERPRVRVKVTQVQEKLSLASGAVLIRPRNFKLGQQYSHDEHNR